MPQVIPLAMAAVGSATAVSVAAAIITVGASIYGSAKQRKLKRQAKKKFNAGLQDRTVSGIATDAPHRYVYGRTRVGSNIVAIFKSGNKDQYQHMVCVHADHECDGIEEVYVAGKKISNNRDAQGWVQDGEFTSTKTQYNSVQVQTTQTTVTLPHTPLAGSLGVVMQYSDGSDPWPFSVSGNVVTISPPPEGYTGFGYRFVVGYNYTETISRVRVTHHLGYPGEPADSYLMSVVPDKWTSQHRLSGKCYSVVTVDLNEPDFQGGPPSVDVVMRGAKLYDFRTGITAWEQNAVLAIYHYLTSEMCGIPAADLPMAKWIAAANVAGQVLSGGQRYTINGTVTADQAQGDVLEQMADAMAGNIVSTTWDISAGAYTAPVMALQKEDIVGDWAINPGASEGELFNGVRGQFFSAEAGYVSTDFQPYQNSTFVNADGRSLWADRQFPFTDQTWRVHSLCRIEMEQIRNGLTFKALFSLKAWGLKVDDRVVLRHDVFGWSSKVFIVLDKRYVPVTGAIELTLKEDDPSIWDGIDAFTVDATPNTNLGNPFYVAPPASLSWTSGTEDLQIGSDGSITSRMHVRWPEVSLATGFIEIEWQQVGAGVWQKVQANADDTEVYLSPVQDGSFYVVRARCFDPYLNRRSDWAYAPTAKVIGKTEPPSDVSTFMIENGVLSWGAVADLDLAGYRVKFQYGRNDFWGNAAALHDGLLLSSPWAPDVVPPGTVTLLIKAVDTTGNESANSATIYANFGDPIVENLILTYDDAAASYPGEKSNCAVDTGLLKADDSGDLFWGGANEPFWGADSAVFWPTATYKPAAYIVSYTVAPDEAGSRLTLLLGVDAASYTVEYRYETQGEFWAADASHFWGADYARFWPAPTAWQTWPGAIEAIVEGEIQFRIAMAGGIHRAVISTLALQFDVEDESEAFSDIAISVSGTRLPVAKAYRSIKNVQLTLQDTGSAAVRVACADKETLGPLIYCYNSSGVKVAGVIDATIQGVKG